MPAHLSPPHATVVETAIASILAAPVTWATPWMIHRVPQARPLPLEVQVDTQNGTAIDRTAVRRRYCSGHRSFDAKSPPVQPSERSRRRQQKTARRLSPRTALLEVGMSRKSTIDNTVHSRTAINADEEPSLNQQMGDFGMEPRLRGPAALSITAVVTRSPFGAAPQR